MSVEILLSTYNGEKYLEEQIESLLNQNVDIHITARDDGSSDNTVNILKRYNKIRVIEGENQGATESFLSLIELAPESEFYAFSDQDDVWDADKLEIAIKKLREFDDIPAIYSGNTRLVDGNLEFIKNEELHPKTDLGSAIVKNYATGCTVVFNKRLMEKLKEYRPHNIPFHDWWANLVCLSLGGVSIYDYEPHMSYRQHGNNVVSGNANIIKKWGSRLKKFNYPYHRNEMAKQILDEYLVDESAKMILQVVANKKNSREIGTGNKIDDLLYRICVGLGKI